MTRHLSVSLYCIVDSSNVYKAARPYMSIHSRGSLWPLSQCHSFKNCAKRTALFVRVPMPIVHDPEVRADERIHQWVRFTVVMIILNIQVTD